MPSLYDNRQFLSVLSPPVAGTSLALQLQDFEFNNTFTLAVSGILTTDSEIQLANKVCTQLNTFFVQNSIYFNGVPTYVDLPSTQGYIATRTDHCVSVWGQSNFIFSASGNNTSSIIHINNAPTLMTVADIRDLAPLKGVSLEDDDGDPLTDLQVATLSQLASAKFIAFSKNPIVLSHYLQEVCTEWQYGIRLYKTPVVDFYPPQSRKPIAFNLFSAIYYTVLKPNFIMEPDGYLTYRFSQNLVDYVESYDWLNDCLIVYKAGFSQIPLEIDNVILEIMPLIVAAIPVGVDLYRGGSFEVRFGGYQEVFNNLMQSVRSFWLSG